MTEHEELLKWGHEAEDRMIFNEKEVARLKGIIAANEKCALCTNMSITNGDMKSQLLSERKWMQNVVELDDRVINHLKAKLAAHDELLEKADGECCKLRLANHELEAKLNEVLK
jgi:hypothetical protein